MGLPCTDTASIELSKAEVVALAIQAMRLECQRLEFDAALAELGANTRICRRAARLRSKYLAAIEAIKLMV
jgi:hypothetical protein